MKILVIQNKMGIGDMVIYLPFIKAISKKFNTPVSILVKESSKAKQFLKDSNIINKIIILERNNKLTIGRHKGLKILAHWECQFESGRGHHNNND
mgnify:CR=1 FL=1